MKPTKSFPRAQLRIVAGNWRSRIIRFPALPGVRPTPDRVRETLFNWLGQDLTDWATLEPFAGSGALSFEALSRGARLAVAWDVERTLTQALLSSAQQLGTNALEVHCQSAETGLAHETRRFDAIFLDPPFADNPWHWLMPACVARLAEGGYIYAEAGHPLEPCPGLERIKSGKAGQVCFGLFQNVKPV